MAKTLLDPQLLDQLKRIFIDGLDSNIFVEFGRGKLVKGKLSITTKARKPHVFFSPIASAASNSYVINDSKNYSFTIISSSGTDASAVFWLAIGK